MSYMNTKIKFGVFYCMKKRGNSVKKINQIQIVIINTHLYFIEFQYV